MADLDSRLRAKIDNSIAHALDAHHAIVQEKHLALSLQLAIDRVANNSFVVTANDGFNRQPIERRRFDRGHVFHTNERKIKCARDRRGRKRENIDKFEQLFEFFLVQNAEALLFVNHHEAEIFEHEIAGNEPMRADDDIDPALAE